MAMKQNKDLMDAFYEYADESTMPFTQLLPEWKLIKELQWDTGFRDLEEISPFMIRLFIETCKNPSPFWHLDGFFYWLERNGYHELYDEYAKVKDERPPAPEKGPSGFACTDKGRIPLGE